MFYVLFDEYNIISTEDFGMVAEYLAAGMRLYGYTDQEDFKNLLMYECTKVII
ncbi:MAG TPA: hypothetical protein VGE40_13460 [Bacilli bacterium]